MKFADSKPTTTATLLKTGVRCYFISKVKDKRCRHARVRKPMQTSLRFRCAQGVAYNDGATLNKSDSTP